MLVLKSTYNKLLQVSKEKIEQLEDEIKYLNKKLEKPAPSKRKFILTFLDEKDTLEVEGETFEFCKPEEGGGFAVLRKDNKCVRWFKEAPIEIVSKWE